MKTNLNIIPKNSIMMSRPLFSNFFDKDGITSIENFLNTFKFSDYVDNVNLGSSEFMNSYLIEDGVTFAFPTPGYDKSELKVVINKNTLQISAKSEREEFNKTMSLSTFIPKTLDTNKEVTTEYKNGMLFVRFEKKDESAEQREIPIV